MLLHGNSIKFSILIGLCLFLFASKVGNSQDSRTPNDLKLMTEKQLLRCVDNDACIRQHDDWEVAEELAARADVAFMTGAYARADAAQRGVLVKALSYIDDPRVLAFMRRIAFKNLKPGQPDYDPTYFPLQYLAKRCDKRALARLSRYANIKDAYPVGCMWWQDTVAEFGTCRYRPAIPYLIEALTTACVGIDENALDGLNKLLPGVCTAEFKTPEAAQECYAKAAQKRGIRLYRKH